MSIGALSRPLEMPPHPRTSLVGRDREIKAIAALLIDKAVPLVTLTGPGGVGKTRLSLAVVHHVAPDFAHGAVFVPLAALRDADLLLPAIARAVGVSEVGEGALTGRLIAFLRSRQVLLILDNLEQILSGAASVVAELLGSCPLIQLLVTSRAPLRVQGEHEFPLSPLIVPAVNRSAAGVMENDAVVLFTERARAVRPYFVLSDANAPTVAEICRRLDGLPLAIELAAARVKVLSSEALLALLANRLTVLTGGTRDLPDRLQTMRRAIAWSYDLLAPEEQTLFRRLAVFAGGCTLPTAAAVLGEEPLTVLDGITTLVDQSLLVRGDGDAGPPRFTMLETIRAYGLEQLAAHEEMDTLGDRHATYFLSLSAEAPDALYKYGDDPWTEQDQIDWSMWWERDQAAWLDRLEHEHDNLRQTLSWFLEHGDAEEALGLAVNLMFFWSVRGYLIEGRGWLERALAQNSDGVSVIRGQALQWIGSDAVAQGEYERGEKLLAASLAIAQDLGHEIGIGSLMLTMGGSAGSRGDLNLATTRSEEARERFQQAGYMVGVASATVQLAMCARDQGDHTEAARLHEEAVALARQLRDPGGIAHSLQLYGHLRLLQGNDIQAEALFTEALTLYRTLGAKDAIASILSNLGDLAADQRADHTGALALYQEALALQREIENPDAIAFTLSQLGAVAIRQGNTDQAEAWCQEALTLRRSTGDTVGIAATLNRLGALARVRDRPAEAATAYASSLELSRGLLVETDDRAVSAPLGAKLAIAEGLCAVAALEAEQRHGVKAARLLGAEDALRSALGIPRPYVDLESYTRDVSTIRAQLGEVGFDSAFAAGRELPLKKAVAEALTATDPTRVNREAPKVAADPHGLTPREHEILGLLVRRLTDQEIADALFISLRTVTTHVARVRDKLGVGSRREAAAYAVRHALV